MMMSNIFYDTSSLLMLNLDQLPTDSNMVISSITLKELENIKTSNTKDSELKYKARKLIHFLIENKNLYTVWVFDNKMLTPIEEKDLEINNDTKILATAIDYEKKVCPDNLIFATNDLSLYNIANLFFGEDSICQIKPIDNPYFGFKEIVVADEELAEIYSNKYTNPCELLTNQYLLIKNINNEIVDILKWNGEEICPINTRPIETKWFGKISAYNGDPYQKMVIDSLFSNQMTVIRGPAGTGKSLCGLSYLFSLLEKRKIDRIYIFCNPVATADSAKLGFYPGDKDMKLMDSQIGNFLVSKLGDYGYVQQLIDDGLLVLLPAADCRGVSIPANTGVYITEAQNSTISLMKLMVQRIEEDVKCVIEGDDYAQVDLATYQDKNNGLRRLSEVFRGQDFYGEITLQNCYRSKIAKQAELM